MLIKISTGAFEKECNDEVFNGADQDDFPDWDDGFFETEKGKKPLKKVYMNNFSIEVQTPKTPKGGKKGGRKSKKAFKALAQDQF